MVVIIWVPLSGGFLIVSNLHIPSPYIFVSRVKHLLPVRFWRKQRVASFEAADRSGALHFLLCVLVLTPLTGFLA